MRTGECVLLGHVFTMGFVLSVIAARVSTGSGVPEGPCRAGEVAGMVRSQIRWRLWILPVGLAGSTLTSALSVFGM